MIEFKEHYTAEQLANPQANLPPATVTYVDLRYGIYRTFVLAGATPSAVELRRIREQLVTEGPKIYEAGPQARAKQDELRRVRAETRWPARPNRVGNLVRTLFGRATDLFIPTLSAQIGCSGQWYGVIGTQDPAGYDLAQLYPILSWGRNPYWYAYGNWGYWAAFPTPAGTHWYFDWGRYEDWNPPFYGGPPDNAGDMCAEAQFHNTDFPGNPPPVPVYVDLQDMIIRNQNRSVDRYPSMSAWGAPSYQLLRNVPSGSYALSYYDSCS